MKTEVIEAKVSVSQELREAAIALLAEIGFHAFEETDQGVDAYIEAPHFDLTRFEETLNILGRKNAHYHLNKLQPKNWNMLWEQSWQAIAIDNFCQIIPSFNQPKPAFLHTIIIDPKMSFGTGHHQTTRLMIHHMKKLDIKDKDVLDMGCGTGVLAILAAKMGAESVLAIDIDSWSIENALENIKNNGLDNVHLMEGDAQSIPDVKFDIILANINRNVLLLDIAIYVQHLKDNGQLVLSGFYVNDMPIILDCCIQLGMNLAHPLTEENWMALHLVKKVKN